MPAKVSVPKPSTPQGYTAKEAAHIIGVSGKSFRRMIRKGKVEAIKFSGRWYISPKALAEFNKAREEANKAKEEENKEES